MQISVKVTAGASKERIEVLKNKRFRISVRQKPEAGAANARVVELVAKHFKVPTKAVHILRGHKSSSKVLEVD
jgi:uncharacterized protein (TIGR00251 family)